MTASLRDAMENLDISNSKICLIVNDSDELIGTLSDGDIRRALLYGKNLGSPVTCALNRNPVTVREDTKYTELLKTALSLKIQHLPKIDTGGKVIGLEIIGSYASTIAPKSNLVVIMAGGLGTRLQPYTNDIPKPMLPIENKPMLELIITRLIEFGLHRFLIAVNYKSEMIMNYFGNGKQWNAEIKYLQEDMQLGTAGPLSLIPKKPNKPVVVMNADLLTKIDFDTLLKTHVKSNCQATICVRQYKQSVPFGVTRVNNNRVYGIDEKPETKHLISAGIYVLEPDTLEYIKKNTYTDMTDLLVDFIAKGLEVSAFPIHEYWKDIGRIEDLEQANIDFKEEFQ